MSELFWGAEDEACVYYVVSPSSGPGYQIYTEEKIQAIGGVHALERILESESYWFCSLGRIRGEHKLSGFAFTDSALARLSDPPEHTWKIGRRNPAYGKSELAHWVFRLMFGAIEQMLDLWKQVDEGVVDAVVLKELKFSPQRLTALIGALNALQKVQDVVEITVMKYSYDVSWVGRPFPADLVTAEFSFNLPLEFRWSASEKLIGIQVMQLGLC